MDLNFVASDFAKQPGSVTALMRLFLRIHKNSVASDAKQ